MASWEAPPVFTLHEEATHGTLNQLSNDLDYLRPSDPFSRTFNVPSSAEFDVTSATLATFTIPPQGFSFMFRVWAMLLLAGTESGDNIEADIFYGVGLLVKQQQTVLNGLASYSLMSPWEEVPGGGSFTLSLEAGVTSGSGAFTSAADGTAGFMAGEWVPMG